MSPFGLLGGGLMTGFGGHGLNQANIFDMNSFGTGGGMQGFTSMQTFSSGGAPGMGMRSSSTSTKFVNGKKVTTKRYVIILNVRKTHLWETFLPSGWRP